MRCLTVIDFSSTYSQLFRLKNFSFFLQLTKKNEVSETKVRKQIETQLPVHLRQLALGALDACKDVRKYFNSNFYLIIRQFDSNMI